MRAGTLVAVTMVSGLWACGKVKGNPDAAGPPIDAPAIDSPMADGPPAGPTPKLHWTFDGNLNNTGSIPGFALIGMGGGPQFVAGKVGMAASFPAGAFSNVAGVRNQ